MRLTDGLLTILLLTPLLPAASQESDALGKRVRLSYRCLAAPCQETGVLAAWQKDSVSLSIDGTTRRFSRSALTDLEISRGRQSHWLAGAGIGFVAGTGIAFLVMHTGGSTSICDTGRNQDAIKSTECLGLATAGKR